MRRNTKLAAASLPLVVSGHVGIFAILYSLPGDLPTVSELIRDHPGYYSLLMLANGAWLAWFVRTLWRDGFLQRCGSALASTTLHVLDAFQTSPDTGRPLHIHGFVRLPEGEEPPTPEFFRGRNMVHTKRPWHRFAKGGQGHLWIATAFGYVHPVEGRYEVMDPVVVKCVDEGSIFAQDLREWHYDRLPKDRYVRFRHTNGHLTHPFPLGRRVAPLPTWIPLASLPVSPNLPGGTTRIEFPPMRMDPINELRFVFESHEPSWKNLPVIEDTFGATEKIPPGEDAEDYLVFRINDGRGAVALERPGVSDTMGRFSSFKHSPGFGVALRLVSDSHGVVSAFVTEQNQHTIAGMLSVYFN